MTVQLAKAPAGRPHEELLRWAAKGIWHGDLQEATIAGTLSAAVAPTIHGLLEAAHLAFANERELRIRPDDIQLAIAQVVARRVASDPDRYRKELGIKHDGKQTIVVRNDTLVKGESVSAAAPKWETVFPVFQAEINKLCTATPVLAAVQTEFSTTTDRDRVVRQIALMDVVQNYFDFVVRTRCGITAVTLEGSKADWTKLVASLSAYDAVGLGWWTEPVRRVLEHFVSAFDGKQELAFWKSLYKYESQSGGCSVDGWILLFAPTSVAGPEKVLTHKSKWDQHLYAHAIDDLGSLPSGLAAVPFIWEYYTERIPMHFFGGFAAANSISKQAHAPAVGWAVTRD